MSNKQPVFERSNVSDFLILRHSKNVNQIKKYLKNKSIGAFRILLEALLSNHLLQHILTLFNHVVFEAELFDFSAHSIQRYYFGLQDVLQENDHKSYHPLLVHFIL